MKRKNLIFCIGLVGIALISAKILYPTPPKEPKNTRFVKVTKDGKEIGIWKGPWQCVFDRETALLWEVKGYYQDLHSKECSFSWFDGRVGTPKRGNCYTKDTRSDLQTLVDYFNQKKLCGVDNWRVPTLKELQSLIYRKTTSHKPLIRTDLFPRTQKAPYWSSDIADELDGFFKGKRGAYALDFRDGKVEKLPFESASFLRVVADAPKNLK